MCRLSLSMKCCQRSLCPDWQRVEQSEALFPCSGLGVRKLPCTKQLLSCVNLLSASAYPIPRRVGSTGVHVCFAMGTKCLCPVYTLQLCVKWCSALQARRKKVMRLGTILPSSSLSPLHEKGWAWLGNPRTAEEVLTLLGDSRELQQIELSAGVFSQP